MAKNDEKECIFWTSKKRRKWRRLNDNVLWIFDYFIMGPVKNSMPFWRGWESINE